MILSARLFGVLMLSLANFSCSRNMNGKVYDFDTGRSISDAEISILSNSGCCVDKETTSDRNGNFDFNYLEKDSYTLSVAKSGYSTLYIDDCDLKISRNCYIDAPLTKTSKNVNQDSLLKIPPSAELEEANNE